MLARLLCGVVAVLVAGPVPGLAAETRPNVVIMLADDQGWGDLGVHGNSNLATPHIDSLAQDGVLFERFFVCPVCSPTRAEFLTGRYHWRGGVRGVSTGEERLDLDERTIADHFKAAGYETGAFGKWHNGSQHPYHPNARGFDEFYGFTSGHWGDYFSPELDHNGATVRGHGYLTDDLTNHALEFISTNRDRPFFCYLPFNTPHSPMQVPDEFWARFAGRELKMRADDAEREDVPKTRAALAMCENIDWNVGRVLARLAGLGLAERTIVVYFSDNGPNSARWNGGMKGIKGTLDEGGLRSPLLVRWSGRLKGGTRVSAIAGAIDLLPTLAELAGLTLPQTKPLDGVSLVPLLTGTSRPWPDRMIYCHWSGRSSLRSQRFRLDPAGHLFDLIDDPGQKRNTAAGHADVARELAAAMSRFEAELARESTGDDGRPFTVGHAARTTLPARDGVPHGGIKRSAAAPNCSFFTNWTRNADDHLTWDVDVGVAGRYEAVVNQTCSAADVGCVIELSFGDQRLSTKVVEAHDPPLYGAGNDRVPRRGESLMKDFKPVVIGVMSLPKGRGTLSLRALDVPGTRVIDVRSLELKRVNF